MDSKFFYLDQLIMCYFNQDYDIYGETIEDILKCYIEVDDQLDFIALINDINLFLEQDDQALEEEFIRRYRGDFNPVRWDTTAKAFLTYVREQVSAHLK